MRNYNYTYNYRFLADWFKANQNIQRREVLDALEIGDYKTLQNWTDGITMMPLSQIMRFCNRYNVNLGCFFYDAEASREINSPVPTADSQMEPAGGWKDCKGKRGQHIYDPTTQVHYVSNVPVELKEYVADCGGDEDDATEKEVEIEQRIRKEYELRTHEERIKYLNIIAAQQKMITDLTNHSLHNIHEPINYSMVSEQLSPIK